MPVQKLLAKIHIAKKELGLDEETYREVLSSEFGVRSSKDLNNAKALKLIRFFREKGWVPKSKPKKYDDQKGDIDSASPKQKRMIEVLWHNIYRGNSETLHLRQFLFNHFKVSDIRFLDKDKAHQAIEALKSMQKRRTMDERR
ncbi:MAG: regulatory protein GemA [Thermodesulfobacteriota bacterium]|nr:regulatory protein GemA [Thermodesulfobacteriota bacterium]